MTATRELQPTLSSDDRPSAPVTVSGGRRGPGRLTAVLGVVVVWVVVWFFTRGSQTLALDGLAKTAFHDRITELRGDLIASRDTNAFMQVANVIGDLCATTVTWLQGLLVEAAFPRPVPEIGWLGVVALAAWIAFAIASWKMSALAAASLLLCGYLGYWEDSIDLLIITMVSIGICLVIGIPFAVWMWSSKVVTAVVTPVLDVLQTMPSFIYLLPIVLFVGIGAPAAVVATVLYALPPVIRIAANGIRTVSPTTIEATDSIGQTAWQRLSKVRLPMAKKTIIVGINQTTMAAFSMAIIAAFVDGPGLGQPVLRGLTTQQVGVAFVAGVCIVILAIMLDRLTTAASVRAEQATRSGANPVTRRIALVAGGVVALVLVFVSRTYLWAAEFPESTIGPTIARNVQAFSTTMTDDFSTVTTGIKDNFTVVVLNPLQALLADSPWWLAGAALLALAVIIGGRSAGVVTLACLAVIYGSGLWNDAMVTLTMTLVGTAIVMMLAIVLGVWMAWSHTADAVVRPVLDAGQTLPPFVYLIPALALFEPTRFTAIVAAVIYAAPIAIKLVVDGIRQVAPTSVEAATAAGSNTRQLITKVQLPMAKSSIVLAANQGLLYVLSMAVIGALVGGGGLGYDAVLGFSQGEFYGKGLAAGAAIVAIGIMLDRVTRGAVRAGSRNPSASLVVRTHSIPGLGSR
jgi:glycine betaine/proline transport system permease protein